MNFSYYTPTIVSADIIALLLIFLSTVSAWCVLSISPVQSARYICESVDEIILLVVKRQSRGTECKSISRVTRASDKRGGHCIHYNCSEMIKPKQCPKGSPKMYIRLIRGPEYIYRGKIALLSFFTGDWPSINSVARLSINAGSTVTLYPPSPSDLLRISI